MHGVGGVLRAQRLQGPAEKGLVGRLYRRTQVIAVQRQGRQQQEIVRVEPAARFTVQGPPHVGHPAILAEPDRLPAQLLEERVFRAERCQRRLGNLRMRSPCLALPLRAASARGRRKTLSSPRTEKVAFFIGVAPGQEDPTGWRLAHFAASGIPISMEFQVPLLYPAATLISTRKTSPGHQGTNSKGDLAELRGAGMGYMPTAFPGFSRDNMHRAKPGTSLIARRKGEFSWRQFAIFKALGIRTVFVGMFDEADEGTAIDKVANVVPEGRYFATYEGLPSNWYLKLTGAATRMIRGDSFITQSIFLHAFFWMRKLNVQCFMGL